MSHERPTGDEAAEVNFDYIKAQAFRVVHVDGAIGGLTPSRFVHAALYSERPAIPQRIVHQVAPDGTLGPRIDAQMLSRGGIVREVEVDLIMSAEVAQNLGIWLLQRASEAFAGLQEQPDNTGEEK